MSRNARNGESGKKNRQRASENLNEIKRGIPCKEEKLMKMANLAKTRHGFGQDSFWTPKVAPWRLVIIKNVVRTSEHPPKS